MKAPPYKNNVDIIYIRLIQKQKAVRENIISANEMSALLLNLVRSLNHNQNKKYKKSTLEAEAQHA